MRVRIPSGPPDRTLVDTEFAMLRGMVCSAALALVLAAGLGHEPAGALSEPPAVATRTPRPLASLLGGTVQLSMPGTILKLTPTATATRDPAGR